MRSLSLLLITCAGAATCAACAAPADDEGDDAGQAPDAEVPTPGQPGPPGCGLPAAAFCDPFDAARPTTSRARELDPAVWSGARSLAGLPNEPGQAVPIGLATLPPCRAGLPAQVTAAQDLLICDTITGLRSNHLLIATAAQNYGQNSVRIRRPLDFAARTATVVFDATLEPGGLLGWVSLAITEDPAAAPSYTKVENEENGAVPRNGIELHFNQNCQTTGQVSVNYIIVYDDYRQTILKPSERHCVAMRPGALNHVEVKLSSRRVEVYASPASDDGVTFAPVELLVAADVALPFTRGYVHLSVHNHASLKYSDDTIDAWIARFDNVGFDGPVLGGWREAEVADALTDGADGMVNLGYRLGDAGTGLGPPLAFSPIEVAGATRAQVSLTSFVLLNTTTPAEVEWVYRLNDGAVHTARYSPAQLALIDALPVFGTIGLVLDVDPAELRDGVNTIALATRNVPLSYPPVVYNVDLVVDER